ncbi:MAG: methionyl-tRNA synthetase [Desulfobacterales bacterium SG8_35]|nr:MAG: methionyl-tRNA synthetase [Desulfobacterales bacterium SG8_35]
MSLYITTPIYYVNAQPHLGHAYTTIVADTYSRFRRLLKEDVRFQTGTDEHGDKIAEAAQAAGIPPKEYADRISNLFREAWPPLNIMPDSFIRTTDPHHIKTVQEILQKVLDGGDIYLGSYSGLYCRGCERFLTDKELVEGNCPDHQAPPQPISESNYFFRMSKYQDWLIDHINKNPDFITPERYKNEVLSFLSEPLEDLCISRPKSRLDWGIPLPFDADFVTYVWFDALINYLTGIGYPDSDDFNHYWSVAEHIIAKDILKPHAIYWPTMLKAIGLPPYKRLHVHGYWNINEAKMSKSIGNVVRPETLRQDFGVDTVRYFLMREMSFGLDASFSDESIIARQNSDLANDLGNLFSRSLTMINKFANGSVPAPADLEPLDEELSKAAEHMVAEYSAHMTSFAFNRALQEVWSLISLANKYIVVSEPWVLAKDPAKTPRLNTVLYCLAETLRLIGLVLAPVMPETSMKMADALGIPPEAHKRQNLIDHGRWGLTQPGINIKLGASLFPRIDKKCHSAHHSQTEKKKEPAQEGPKTALAAGLITFEEFAKLDLRVAEIKAAEKIDKSDRLLKLTVTAPEERTVVAGIAEYYQPQELIGRQVIMVANLKPVKLMGVTSHGMILAARNEQGKLTLSTLADGATPGSKVS